MSCLFSLLSCCGIKREKFQTYWYGVLFTISLTIRRPERKSPTPNRHVSILILQSFSFSDASAISKILRLNETRRLMLTDNLDVTTTFKVGYENPSQFSWEYRSFFGAYPLKDTKALRETGLPQEAKA